MIDASERSAPGDLPGQIELIESLGSRQLVFVRATGKLISTITDALRPLKTGDACHLRFEDVGIHLFDAQTGLSLAQE